MAIKINNSIIVDDSRNIVNAGIVTATSFSGSGTNLTGIVTTLTSQNNFFVGSGNAFLTTGSGNIGIGSTSALRITTGSFNNFFGVGAGSSTTTGCNNVFIGCNAGSRNTTACNNIAIGNLAGCGNASSNLTGSNNIFLGTYSGQNACTANNNVFLGCCSGFRATTGSCNIAIGNLAGCGNATSNLTGIDNIFLGRCSGRNISSGCLNVFIGKNSGFCNTSGRCNVSFGPDAGYCNTTGCNNIAIGYAAGFRNGTGCNNIFLGCYAGGGSIFGTGGSNNIFLGNNSGCCNFGSDNIYLGRSSGRLSESVCGNVFIGMYSGCSVTGSGNVFLGSFSGIAMDLGSCSNTIVLSDGNSGDQSPKLYILPGGGLGFNAGGVIGTAGDFTGTEGQVLTSHGPDLSPTWENAGGGGGSDKFNTAITSTVQFTAKSYDNTELTFPSTAGKRYVIESINVANIDTSVGVGTTVNIAASVVSAGQTCFIAYNLPIVNGGLVELLKEPVVAEPSDVIKMWSLDDNYTGIGTAADVYINYSTYDDVNYFRVHSSTSIGSTDITTIYTSTSNPSVIQSIHVTNRTDDGDYPVSILIQNGGSTTYIAKDLIVPRYSVVEILERPKRIESGGTLKVKVEQTSTIDVIVSGKKIV